MQAPATLRLPPRGRRRFRMVIPAYPAFNVYSAVARRTTALGPVLIATVVNKLPGWDAEVIDENNCRRCVRRDAFGRPDHASLQRARPADVVGFYGGLTSTIPRLHELAARYRDMGVLCVAGGQHFAGANIEESLRAGVDYLVLGEGEDTIRELLQALEQAGDPARVAGLAFRRGDAVVQTDMRQPLAEFDRVPQPDFGLVRYARLRFYPVAWARGCGMACEFCTVRGRVRCPAPEYVLNQMATLLETRGARSFFLVDDLFGQSRAEALRLCALLRDYQATMGVRFDITVQIRLDRGRDAALLSSMRGAGITTVAIGFESPLAEDLAAMDKRLHADRMVELARCYHAAGFMVHGMFILGYPCAEGRVPNDTPLGQRVAAYRRFIRRARIDTVQVLLPVPLPGTELTARLERQRRVYPRALVGWEFYDGNFPLFEPDPPLTPDGLQRGARRIMGRFYRFRSLFGIGLSVLAFPSLLFALPRLRAGWWRWYRGWRNSVLRFGGWVIVRRWTSQLRRGGFGGRLERARASVADLAT